MDQRLGKYVLVDDLGRSGTAGEQLIQRWKSSHTDNRETRAMNIPFGKYTLVERLGVGGMAVVFKARLEGPGDFEKHLAIKTLLPDVSENSEFLCLFEKEARLLAILDHANIVRVHEFDQVDGRCYIAMEYVDGRDLHDVIDRCREMKRPLRVPEVLLIGMEICRGLAYAHGELTPGGHVVIHRDISPQNVLLSRAGEVKIADFGIAKLLSGLHYTNTGRRIGKNTYMSPEQARCEELDGRADIFSLGCVLWELLTCQKLFEASDGIPVLSDALEIKPPSTFNKDVPTQLDRLVMRALERNRDCRIPSATDLGRGLEDMLSSFPGVRRSTDLSELYQHLFAGVDRKVIELSSTAKTINSKPAKTAREIPTPPTLCDKPAPQGRRHGWSRPWVLPVLLSALVSLICTGSMMQHSPAAVSTSTGVELQGQSDIKPSGAVSKQADGPQTRHVASTALEGESRSLKGKKKPTKQKAIAHGWLSINAIPWADVYWEGKRLGETPLERVKMPVGKHALVLVNNCLGDNRTVEVQILKGQLTKKVVDLLK